MEVTFNGPNMDFLLYTAATTALVGLSGYAQLQYLPLRTVKRIFMETQKFLSWEKPLCQSTTMDKPKRYLCLSLTHKPAIIFLNVIGWELLVFKFSLLIPVLFYH